MSSVVAQASSNAMEKSELSRVRSGASAGNVESVSAASRLALNVECVPTRKAIAESPGRFEIGSGVSLPTPWQQPQSCCSRVSQEPFIFHHPCAKQECRDRDGRDRCRSAQFPG